MSIYGIGVSALGAAQAGLTATNHNISNVNTLGFHRQQIVQGTNVPQFTGIGFMGQGVHVDTVKRLYNELLDSQVMQAQAQSSQLDTYATQIKQIDNMLADPNAGLSPALQEFFSGVQDVAANPASVPSRQAMLSSGQAMASRFQSINQRFSEIRDGVNSEIRNSVGAVNSYAVQIANMNQQIVIAQSSSGDQQPANDLLDQRDQLIAELNKFVKVSTVKQGDGSLNVFIGNGQTLVINNQSFTLAAAPSLEDPERFEVGLRSAGNTVLLGQGSLQGGSLGGILAFRNETLDVAQNQLGRVALGLAQTFNDQHRLGVDLKGVMGENFFNVAAPKVIPNTRNPVGTSTPTVTFNNVAAVTTNDYRLSYAGTSWSLLDISTGQSIAMTGAGTFTSPYFADGLSIVVPNTPPSGSASFLIKPTINGARDIAISLTDPAKIAAATPIRTAATLSNIGSGRISAGTVNSFNDQVTVTFNASRLTGSVAANLTVTTSTNDKFNISADGGAPVTVTLPPGAPYASATALAAQTQTSINAALAGAGQAGRVSVNADASGVISIVSNSVGATASVDVTPVASNTGMGSLLGTPTNTAFDVMDATTGALLAKNEVYTSGGSISFNGWTVNISNGTGAPAVGDVFTIDKTVTSTTSPTATIGKAMLQSPPVDPFLGNSVRIVFDTPSVGSLATSFHIEGNFSNVTGPSTILAGVKAPTQGVTTGSDVATQSMLTGSALANLTIAFGVNDQLDITVDGVNSTVTVPPGVYSDALSLAGAVQNAINTDLTLSGAGKSVTVSENAGVIAINSNSFGAASSILVANPGGNTGASDFLGTPTASNVATITTGVNNQLVVLVDGVSATVSVPAGVYSSASLATALQTAINTNPAISGAAKSVTVSQNLGTLSITSNSYGAGSTVSVTGGNGIGNFLGLAPTATAGTDLTSLATGQAQVGTGGVGAYASTGVKTTISGGTMTGPVLGVFTFTGATVTVEGGSYVGSTSFSGLTVTVDAVTGNVSIPAASGTSIASTFNARPATSLAYQANGNNFVTVNGWTVSLSGAVSGGDSFTVENNAGGVADNRNALLMAGLQTESILAGGSVTYQSAYSQLVGLVGNKAHELEVTSKAQANLLSQAQQTQQSMSGVNLDEEAANLMRYQQAYQAAGKMMQIANSLFDTLLSLGK